MWRSSLSWYRLEYIFIASTTVANLRSLCMVVFLTYHSQPVIVLANLTTIPPYWRYNFLVNCHLVGD